MAALANSQPLGDRCTCSFQILRYHDWLAAPPSSTRRGPRKAGMRAFLNQIALKLPECTEQMEDEAPGRGRRVDPLSEGTKPGIELFHRPYRLDRMGQ
jgi:hypothetical protein